MRRSNNIQNHARHRVGLILAIAGLMSAATLLLGTARVATAQTVYPSWSYTGSLNTGRERGTATLLPNGKVLAAGGSSDNSAELYDPATGIWTPTGNLKEARILPTAALLPNGKVLIAGGFNNCSTSRCVTLNSAELYDPVTGMWTSTGSLNTARFVHTMTVLSDGRVLVAGGWDFAVNSNFNTAELYNPATGTWSHTGNLNTARAVHTATLLPSGKVLVAGGADTLSHVTDSAELFDPSTGTWAYTGNLNTARTLPTATLLANGKVLIAGGDVVNVAIFNSSELYDPATGTWSATGNLSTARVFHTATLLSSGNVLVVGSFSDALNSAELYDPATGRWTITAANLTTARGGSTATLLPNGKVLVAGGFSGNTAELYDPGSSPNINIVDDAKFFVHQHYIDFLNRVPDKDGLAFWTNEIASCGTNQQCIEVKRINVSAAFYLSIEFQETGYFVYRVNKAAHGNLPGAPVPVKVDEFLGETAQVGQGVIVGQPGWEQMLESNKQLFLFDPDVGDDRFTSAYLASMTPAEFVDTLFANAGVVPSASDRTVTINEFDSATTTADLAARARALRRVVDNSTLRQQEFNRAFVLMQYFGYLRRNPNDPPEPTLDFQGYNFWLTKLNSFSGNFVQAEMVKAFISSTEYRQRFGL